MPHCLTGFSKGVYFAICAYYGCIIEALAVVHANCIIKTGCIISAGAVINHASTCCEGVHVDCNATIEGCCLVPMETKICSGEVYKKRYCKSRGLILSPQRHVENLSDFTRHTSK